MLRFTFSILLLGASFTAVTPAKADPYRWCAQVSSDAEPSCYFVTFDKCRTFIMTSGGVCFSRVLADDSKAKVRQASRSTVTAASR